MTIYPPAKRYTMNYGEYLEIGKRRGWRVANHYVDIYDRLMGTGSYLRPETDYATHVVECQQRASTVPALEPDGAMGYKYTIEAAHGVPVGCEWMPAPCRAIVVYNPPVAWTPVSTLQPVISLFHPSMLSEGVAA